MEVSWSASHTDQLTLDKWVHGTHRIWSWVVCRASMDIPEISIPDRLGCSPMTTPTMLSQLPFNNSNLKKISLFQPVKHKCFWNLQLKSLENITDNNLFMENYNVQKKERLEEDKHNTIHPLQLSSYHNNKNFTQCNIVNNAGNAMRYTYKHSHAHSIQ